MKPTIKNYVFLHVAFWYILSLWFTWNGQLNP